MMKHCPLWLITSLLLLAACMVQASPGYMFPIVVKGKVTIDYPRMLARPIELNGEWIFYKDKLLTPADLSSPASLPEPGYIQVPVIWNRQSDSRTGEPLSSQGYGTYYLQVTFNDWHKGPLALRMPDVFSAYRLWVNGREVARNGTPGVSRQSSRPYWLPAVKVVQSERDTLELVLQVSNFHHVKGGIGEPLALGNPEMLLALKTRDEALAFTLFGSFVVCGLLLLGVFFAGKRPGRLLVCHLLSGTQLLPHWGRRLPPTWAGWLVAVVCLHTVGVPFGLSQRGLILVVYVPHAAGLSEQRHYPCGCGCTVVAGHYRSGIALAMVYGFYAPMAGGKLPEHHLWQMGHGQRALAQGRKNDFSGPLPDFADDYVCIGAGRCVRVVGR
jgi:hypothetical protein